MTDFSHNCMTSGVHHGRDDIAYYSSLADIELSDGAVFFMVEQAINADAQQWVDEGVMSQEWANLVKELWQERFDDILASARENAKRYKQECEKPVPAGWNSPQQQREGETNPPQNDHVNYICRACATPAAIQAADQLGTSAHIKHV